MYLRKKNIILLKFKLKKGKHRIYIKKSYIEVKI